MPFTYHNLLQAEHPIFSTCTSSSMDNSHGNSYFSTASSEYFLGHRQLITLNSGFWARQLCAIDQLKVRNKVQLVGY